MRDIKVIVDSCSDLTSEILDGYGIDQVCMRTVYHGKEVPASLRWESYTPQELYATMRGGERVTTAQVPVEEFMTVFKKYLDNGMDIFYIACPTAQSGSLNTSLVVAKQLMEKYSGSRIECINALNSNIGHGMLAMKAVDLIREGKSFDEVLKTVSDMRLHINQFVTINTLEWLRKAGRVKAGKAFFGDLMGVKPILISDADGAQTPIKKVKGRLNGLNEIVDLMAQAIENPENQTVYLEHSDCPQREIDYLISRVKEKIPCKDIKVLFIGPIVGSSVGPDTIGLWAVGKEVTYRAGDAS